MPLTPTACATLASSKPAAANAARICSMSPPVREKGRARVGSAMCSGITGPPAGVEGPLPFRLIFGDTGVGQAMGDRLCPTTGPRSAETVRIGGGSLLALLPVEIPALVDELVEALARPAEMVFL